MRTHLIAAFILWIPLVGILPGQSRSQPPVIFSDPLLNSPEDIAYDARRDCFYITNYAGDTVVRMDTAGHCTMFLDSINSPMGVAVCGDTILVSSNSPSRLTALDADTRAVLFQVNVPQALHLAQIEADTTSGVAYIVEQRGMIIRLNYRAPSYSVFVPIGSGLAYGSQSSEVDTGGHLLYVFQWSAGSIMGVNLDDSTQVAAAAPAGISQITASLSGPRGEIYVSSWLGNAVYCYDPGLPGPPAGVASGFVQPTGLTYRPANHAVYVCNYGDNTIGMALLPAPPPVPVLLDPPEGSLQEPSTPLFRWNSSPGADSYHLGVSDDSLFSTALLDDSTITDTSRTAGPLPAPAVLFWRVRAANSVGWSPWSPARSFCTTALVTESYPFQPLWNAVSLPLTVQNPAASALFPQAAGGAFAFLPATGYVPGDSLDTGVGYWIKFGDSSSASITGWTRIRDTVSLHQGWNLIGTLSRPVPVSTLRTVPPGIILNGYYGYQGSYEPAETLHPARAYWVKSSAPGRLILP
ncbi:MAG: hypothetical protein WB626_08235 [Bacteroidota bacterium]